MQISRTVVDRLLLMWPERRGTVPWLIMWRVSSLELEVSCPSAVVHSIVSRYLYSELHVSTAIGFLVMHSPHILDYKWWISWSFFFEDVWNVLICWPQDPSNFCDTYKTCLSILSTALCTVQYHAQIDNEALGTMCICSAPSVHSGVCLASSKSHRYTSWRFSNHCVDPLSSYPTLEQLSQLECDQWLQLGVRLGLGNDQLDTIKKSQHPTTETLQAAKLKNIDMQWKDIVEALVSIDEYKLAESVCSQQG